jgi:hypothetical protein
LLGRLDELYDLGKAFFHCGVDRLFRHFPNTSIVFALSTAIAICVRIRILKFSTIYDYLYLNLSSSAVPQ